MQWSLMSIAGLLLPAALAAQSAAAGTIIEDGTRRPLAGVEVVLEATEHQTVTDSAGRFILTGLPTGRRILLFRSVGYRPVRSFLILVRGDTARVDGLMVAEGVRLDSVVVTGRVPGPRGIGREAFGERQRLGMGKFIDAPELRRADSRRTSDVLRSLAGIRIITARDTIAGGRVWHRAAGRGNFINPAALGADSPCWMSVMLDGVYLYRSTGAIGLGEPTDFGREVPVSSLERIEVYRSAAEVPLEFGGSTHQCGLIVLWGRQGGR